MKKGKRLEEELFVIGVYVLIVAVLLWSVYHFLLQEQLPDVPCMFQTFFGVYCPGCGGTRACVAFVHGHFLQSLWYHPLVLYSAVLYVGFMITNGMEMVRVPHVRGWRFHTLYLYGAVGIIVFHVLEKNILKFFFHIYL